jgi:hypothetical protein
MSQLGVLAAVLFGAVVFGMWVTEPPSQAPAGIATPAAVTPREDRMAAERRLCELANRGGGQAVVGELAAEPGLRYSVAVAGLTYADREDYLPELLRACRAAGAL